MRRHSFHLRTSDPEQFQEQIRPISGSCRVRPAKGTGFQISVQAARLHKLSLFNVRAPSTVVDTPPPHNHFGLSIPLGRPFSSIDSKRRYRFSEDAWLSCAIGVSIRTLSRGFSKRWGTGPMSFLKTRRLEAAYRDLLGAEAGATSVTEVAALRYGFTHFGRSVVEYKRAFRESPSETLRDWVLRADLESFSKASLTNYLSSVFIRICGPAAFVISYGFNKPSTT